jgi:hypothetical protein
MVGTGSGAGLFWNVGSSAVLDTYTIFMGNILALTSVDAKTGASNQCGRLLADTGAVTLSHNSLSGQCAGALLGSGGLGGGLDVTGVAGAREVSILASAPLAAVPLAVVPVPGAFGLLALGLAGLGVRRGRRVARHGVIGA